MRITMRTLYAGPRGTMRPGVTYDVGEALGMQLVGGGFAKGEDDATLEAQEVEVAAPPDDSEITEAQDEEITLPRGRRRSGPRDGESEAEAEAAAEA